jgi:hypothetical protein
MLRDTLGTFPYFMNVLETLMRSKLLFGWDITLLLVIVAFLYVCFDKICAVIAIIAVAKSGQSGVDINSMIKELVGMNGDFAKTMISLVGTFFTIVLAGNLFKNQQESEKESKPASGLVIQPTLNVGSVPNQPSAPPSKPPSPIPAPSSPQPAAKTVTITEIPD